MEMTPDIDDLGNSTLAESSGGISATEVRDELDRILASPMFAGARRPSGFLRYVVETCLNGGGARIKEYLIGVDVFGRSAEYDPRVDPVVRVEAGRLRTKLGQYYAGPGHDDRIVIDLPKGSYVPEFRRQASMGGGIPAAPIGAAAADAAPAPAANDTVVASPVGPARQWQLWLVGATAAALVAGLGAHHYRSHQQLHMTEGEPIVLADFANSTGDVLFDDSLKTALEFSLRQSPFFRVLSDGDVAKTLKLMNRPAGAKLNLEVARDLCQRAGSKAYITGAIGVLGTKYVLELKAVNCQTGGELADEQVTAASKDKVVDAIGEAASKLRGELGESLATVQKFDIPLAEVTTSSLEALKAYTLGNQAFTERGGAAALPYHLRAVELDPSFALAYRAVGEDYGTMEESGRAREYLTKAFELREHTSEREKIAIATYYYNVVTGELDKSLQTCREKIQSYPSDLPYLCLGSVYCRLGQYEKAVEAFSQSVRRTPDSGLPYGALAISLLAVQRFDEAKRIGQQALSRKLDDLWLRQALYDIGFAEGDPSAMAEQQQWFGSNPSFENLGLALASDTEAYVGHIRQARELTQRAVDSAVQADNREGGALYQANAALQQAAYGNVVESRQSAAKALRLAPTSAGVQSVAALALARAGEAARARSLAQDLEKRLPLDTQMRSLWLPAIQAQLSLKEKNPAEALQDLQASLPLELGGTSFVVNESCLYQVYLRGEAYLAHGQGRPAAGEFQKILDHSGIVANCWTGALAHLGVARANALQSRTTQGVESDAARVRALDAYKAFLTLWKDADADIPILKEATTEYAQLL
jgi:tetratricopeptide (TPR) repeat protein